MALLAGAIAPAWSTDTDKAELPISTSSFAAVEEPSAALLPESVRTLTPESAANSAPTPDAAVLRQAIDRYRAGDVEGGDRVRASITDGAARALSEWVAIRSVSSLGFYRIAEFLRSNPDWPLSPLLRRRAEEALLADRKPPAIVRAFFATQRPATPAGKLALAIAFRADGLERDASAIVRESWREDTFGREFEAKLLDNFPDVVAQADHRYRMERFIFKQNWDAATRVAAFAGKDYIVLVKARRAVEDRSSKAGVALDAVPASLRSDTSYLFARAQNLRRIDKAGEAAKVVAKASRNPDVLVDGDEWWVERRMIARKLLDNGDPKTAYEVVRNPGAKSNEKRIEANFHAGWIALRFMNDPVLAAGHFADAAKIAETPISIARSAYWQGRAAEAAGQTDDALRFFERAAGHSITYYGQLARAKLGEDRLPLRPPAILDDPGRAAFENLATTKSIRLLKAAGASDLTLPLFVDLALRLNSASQLNAVGDLAAEYRDPRALLVVGKAAVQRGFPLDLHAYPTIGIPAFETIGTPVEKAMVYAIARQESAFDPRAQSGVGARGLMQLMPATARRTAQRFGVNFDQDRLLDDPAYNAKLGSAHLGELMQDWKGSYILAFASYNAGGGNVKKWIDTYGDPRSPAIDPVDWVERIPFAETRNYVQRVMENLQVYRNRLGERRALLIESDLKRGGVVQ